MIRQEYIDFIAKFEELNPYELDHLTKMFFQEYQTWLKSHPNSNAPLTEGDLKEMMIQAMKATHFNLAELKVESAKLNLATLKLKYYEHP